MERYVEERTSSTTSKIGVLWTKTAERSQSLFFFACRRSPLGVASDVLQLSSSFYRFSLFLFLPFFTPLTAFSFSAWPIFSPSFSLLLGNQGFSKSCLATSCAFGKL